MSLHILAEMQKSLPEKIFETIPILSMFKVIIQILGNVRWVSQYKSTTNLIMIKVINFIFMKLLLLSK